MIAGSHLVVSALVAIHLFAIAFAKTDEPENPKEDIVHFGTMHEAIGQQRHQGRTTFAKLVNRPHFYAVAALSGLRGEATVVDGKLIATTVDEQGRLKPLTESAGELQATMLVGKYVDSWSEHIVPKDVPADAFDAYVAEVAEKAGIDTHKPFVFTLEGNLRDVRLHVINGACPIHARIKKIDLPDNKRPFEANFAKIEGTIVGLFARDAVGEFTHPATTTHSHLVFTDPTSKAKVTGHVENVGIGKGTVLRLPKP